MACKITQCKEFGLMISREQISLDLHPYTVLDRCALHLAILYIYGANSPLGL